MVYELAAKMGAGLSVETKMGAGSKFTVVLPLEEK
jgi:signal transduction histidine kinase